MAAVSTGTPTLSLVGDEEEEEEGCMGGHDEPQAPHLLSASLLQRALPWILGRMEEEE